VNHNVFVNLRDGGFKAGNAFLIAMRLPVRAVSFGGFESLATQPAAMWAGSIGERASEAAGIAPGLVRLAAQLPNHLSSVSNRTS
jgi:cystathionine beta-lyase/cystathionine gamma-synthase